MIIKATVRGNGGQLTAYLLNSPKNERAELVEMRGFVLDDLKSALAVEQAIAEGKTQCEKPFYHVAFRAAEGEQLTPEQWQHCADELEKAVGLEGHHRAAVMHEQNGEQHMHVVWSRIDPDTLEVAQLSFDHRKCQQVARELELELGLKQLRNQKQERQLDAPTYSESEQARRKGQNLKATREAIREAWNESRDGREFAEELEQRGLLLARGDRRDFVAVDEQGSVHSIGKRTTGASAAAVREKLADLEREKVPTIEEARERQELEREERLEREEARQIAQESRRETGREEASPRHQPKRGQEQEPQQTQERGGEQMRGDRAAMGVVNSTFRAMEGIADFFVGGSPPKTPQERKAERQEAAERAQEAQERKPEPEAPKKLNIDEVLAGYRAGRQEELERNRNMDVETRQRLEQERERERERDRWRGRER